MGERGPKPIDVKELKFAAQRWAALLFGMRDGAPGVIERWERGVIVDLVSQKKVPQKRVPQKKKRRETEEWLEKLEKEGWHVRWPLWPSPKVWEQLKRARSVKEMRKAIGALRNWRRRNANLVASDEVLRRAKSDAVIFLRAKRLPNYPGEANTNDDKRILFLSKVLAGFELGLASLTTTKKLSHWRCENYWKTVGVQYVESFKSPQKGEKQ